MSKYGVFSGNPKTEWLTDSADSDRNMKILETFSYTDPDGRVWETPAGSVVNGASIPRPLWTTVGSPYTGDYRRASIVHDVACDDSSIDRKEADKMFYYACLCGGCSRMEASLLYAGVRIGAWTSQNIPMETFAAANLAKRVRERPLIEESKVQLKFAEIARDLEPIGDTASFEEIEKTVSKHVREKA